MPTIGELRGIRIQVIGESNEDESGLVWGYPLVPEEGQPIIWNGDKWIALIKEKK